RHTCLEYLKSRWPDVPTGLLYDHEVAQPWRRARRLGAESVNLQHLLIRPDTVAACHEAGVQVAAWTVNHPARIAEMYRWGVDVLISNHPDVAETVRRQWLKEDSTWPSS
ncbi:MAG: glycerophosphodiester phosphodiesterase, partial [Alicyclobacillus shizuokensis]|nr:glycerophosphodiester phosphodiesterase [Alicyclobacillus shizuokensis]